MKLTLDFDELTVGDIEDFEAACHIDIFTMVKADGTLDVPLRAIAPLIWITERQRNPDYTLEDARRVKLSEIERGDPPAAAGPARSTAGSRRSPSSTGTPRRKSAR